MVPYDPRWPDLFAHEASRLTTVLRPWLVAPIEHVGSTAVPGLVAKPIVDMAAVVADIEATEEAIAPLARIRWIFAPEPTDGLSREMSFCTPSVEHRSHHLHVVEAKSPSWREWIAFRDFLRAHQDVAREYGDLKRRLADLHGADNDRDAYRAGEDPWIHSVTARALAEVDEK